MASSPELVSTSIALRRNMVLELDLGGGDKRIERVLAIFPREESVEMIEVHGKQSREYRMSLSELESCIRSGTAHAVPDPFGHLDYPDSYYSAAVIRERDTRLAVFQHYIAASDEDRFDEKRSRELLRSIWDKDQDGPHTTKRRAYELKRIYLQRGQRDNAFLSDRANAGYTRDRRVASPPRTRPGRAYKSGLNPRQGVPITEQLRMELYPTIKAEREKRDENGRKTKWKDVWKTVCQVHFCDHVEVVARQIVAIPKIRSLCPTIRQIQDVYKLGCNPAHALLKREGKVAFNQNYRGMRGNQRDLASWPGHVVQIDFSVGDIFLLDCTHTFVMGRPTMAMIWDTFSQLILGFAVAWRRESYSTLSLALLNMCCDKVAFCNEFHYVIPPGSWPSALFEIGLSDNGAVISYLTEHFRKSLNLHFENTASGRPDHKPVVEYGFKYVNEKLIYTLDGAIQRGHNLRETREAIKLARKTASLTIRDFIEAMAKFCHYHNTSRRIEGYRFTDDQLGRVPPIPLRIWEDGVLHAGGSVREAVDYQTMLVNCLCNGEATVTGSGICFKGKTYTCDTAEREGWLVRGRRSRFKLPILYHPVDLSTIYWKTPAGLKNPSVPLLEPCRRTGVQGDHPNISLAELLQLEKRQGAVDHADAETVAQEEVRFDAEINALHKRARASKVVGGPYPAPPDEVVRELKRKEDAVLHSTSIPRVSSPEHESVEVVDHDELIFADYQILSDLIPQKEQEL